MSKSKFVAPKRLKVYVGSDDIRKAKRGDGYSCPLARAIKKYMPRGYKVFVDNSGNVDVDYRTRTKAQYKYNKSVSNAIKRYDEGKDFTAKYVSLTLKDE